MKLKIRNFCLVLLLGVCPVLQAQTYEQLWKQVEQAGKEGKPQTAIGLTTDIYRKAENEKNSAQMLKAYMERSNYRNSLTPDSFYVNLKGLERWTETTSNLLDKAVLHALIASTYSDYAMQNQWQLSQRADIVNEDPSADMREWSGNMFVQKVWKHSQEALKDTDLLLKSSTETYVPFVTQGSSSSYYKHDMFHLLGSRAVTALGNVQSIDKDTLAKKEIETIYQRMQSVYRKAGNDEALVLVTLDYLNWKWQTGNAIPYRKGTETRVDLTQDPYIVELSKLAEAYKTKDICAEVYLAKAQYLWGKQDAKSALVLCDEAIRLYPSYKRINGLKELKQQIVNPNLNAWAKQTIYPGAEFTLHVQHRNLDGLTVQFYRVNQAEIPLKEEKIDDAFYKNHTTKHSEQRLTLIRPADYLSKDTVLKIKAPTEGFYVMRIVPSTKAEKNIGQFVYSTRFTILSRMISQQQSEVVVLDNQSGQPVTGATLVLTGYDNKTLKTLTTDAEGKVTFDWKNNYKKVRVRKGTDKWMPYVEVYKGFYSYIRSDKPQEMVTLLTDRSLYRPGQMVYVKGIAYTQQLDTAQVMKNRKYLLKLLDVNYQEVAQKLVSTNEFGSFTASFALPAVCLNGFFTLQTESGRTIIRVEEYKRPTFDINFDKLAGSYRLGDRVQLKGRAQTFSGVPMQDLSVQYVVYRSYGFGWWRFFGSDEAVGAGTATLQSDGTFTVPVELQGMKVQAGKSANYRFRVEVTLTNEGGETQSSSYSIVVGEQSLFLEAALGGDRICRDHTVKGTFKGVNLSGEPVEVEGTYSLCRQTDAKKNTYAEQASLTGKFTANRETVLNEWKSLPSGAYRLTLAAKDVQGREVKAESTVELFSLNDTRPAVYSPLWYYEANTSFDTAHPAQFYFGTSFKHTHVLLTVLAGDKVLENRSFALSDSIIRFDYPYKEEYGDGLTVNLCFVKEDQFWEQAVALSKRRPEKILIMKWDVFRDKLRPGQQEEWKLTVKAPQGAAASAEMLALMYDASLDKIWKKNQSLQVNYRLNLPTTHWARSFYQSNHYSYWFQIPGLEIPELEYDYFLLYSRPSLNLTRSSMFISIADVKVNEDSGKGVVLMKQSSRKTAVTEAIEGLEVSDLKEVPNEKLPESTADLRSNFSETAFFYPQLHTNEQGEISFSFTMPESLTRWNFRGFAHTQGMLTGMLDGEATTSKEFMLTPNLPRFVRVGDKTSVAASVANLTGNALSGTVDFILFDPATEEVISTQKQKFSAEAGKTTAVSFQFTATDKYDVLGCRLVADGGTFSDGEQHLLPVLSNKVVLTETVALPVRSQKTYTFSLGKLFNNHSKTATNRQLTVEFTANPVWYAVQALPVLSQPSNDNAISWATAYYANTLAAYIMNSQPRIKAVFDSWKVQGGTKETFLSNLQKNQEVKNILLAESPWVMEAKDEEQQKERIATLFDLNTIAGNKLSAQTKLNELQLSDGSWAWYKGMSGSWYITTYIAVLNARLATLTGEKLDANMLTMQEQAVSYLAGEVRREYNSLLKQEKEGQKVTGISNVVLDYLYLQALSDAKSENNEMDQYFLGKANQMLGTASMKTKARLAVVLDKAGRKQEAQQFIVSMKEHLSKSDEQGMFFAFNETPYSWNGQPIPAHVGVMEALDRVANDTATVEEMKFWLLKQKQTQQWDSPVATADAVYALLERGHSLADDLGAARITFAGKVMDTEKSRMAGVGYIKETFTDKKTVDAKNITVAKRNKGIAWGAVYARFEETTDQVQQQGGELNVDKKLYVERMVNNVRQLVPVTAQTSLSVGDKVVSRITIRTDRAMEFVQLKDQRGACFEPIGNISGYRWNNGFGYYVDVKDASTNFFFDGLGKGVFVLEHAYRVDRTGTYDAGLATIQCAYAPEYASHSAAMTVTIE